ncbi:aspartate aminotransferase family protein [Roseovarius sp. TE539]|uniref:aspartate aminotransferase family protein n=1 Tax=Roseovarius sp. TE539 TaxID=2249812 RepID=UPI001C67F1DA|nr:aminotransferase class III-fold pyridoxal phosphate-dependent enzyme [Roseovarius sp. TE539]
MTRSKQSGMAPGTGGIERAYTDRTPGSAVLARRARKLLPSGVVHDSRHIRPHGLYVTEAKGAHKWDTDGNRYIDYFGGHGALLLGHNPPEIIQAVSEQLARGTHFAASTEAELRWAEAIARLVPSAEKLRFHSSGTEATQMAVRLARAATGKPRLMRFHCHYHGWQDDMTTGYASHFDSGAPAGVPGATAALTLALDPYDEETVARHLHEDDDIAAVILEPLGAATGKVPLSPGFLRRLRAWTEAAGVVLIFDEVITGFRATPGGVQAETGVMPDLTTMAKIVAGGLPGGAVAGRADLFDSLDFDASARTGREKIYHPGTFNACPLSAAAGAVALDMIADGTACARASARAADLRAGMNAALRERGVAWHVHGRHSAFHICLAPALVDLLPDPDDARLASLGRAGLQAQPPDIARLLRLALNLQGVDFSGWPGGLVSAAHTQVDIEETVAAFANALDMLRGEGVL